MKTAHLTAAALACAAFLSGCGGGDDRSANPQGIASGRALPSSLVPVTAGDTILTVSLVTGSQTNIVVKNSANATVTLLKDNGQPVTLIDELPEGIGNHAWMQGTPAGHLRVRLAAGIYRLKTGWTWGVKASGRDATHQVVVEPTSVTAQVELRGSFAMQASQPPGASQVTLTTPAGTQAFSQLWAEDKRAIRAREPNVGQFYYVKAAAKGWPASATDPTVVSQFGGRDVDFQAFQVDPIAFARIEEIKNANDTNAVLTLMNHWQATKHRIADIDTAGKRVRISPVLPDSKEWRLGNGVAQRFILENRLSMLDAPGEWFWSGSTITYKTLTPNAGTTARIINLEVPQLSRLLNVNGTSATSQVKYVQFSGLKFSYTRGEIAPAGYLDGQADTKLPSVIEVNDAHHIEFLNCEVSHTGAYGIWMNNRARAVLVDGSELYDLGAGGIKIGKNDPSATEVSSPQNTGDNDVTANKIHSTGHSFPGAVGIWIGKSSGNRIEGNLIKDTTYSGISVGWTWTADPSEAYDNHIVNNFLTNIGQYALADLGGIYLLGSAPDTVVTGNVIKGVHRYPYYGSLARGIYADQGSGQLNISNNLIYDVNGEGFFLHYGDENYVQNNDFVKVDLAFGIGARSKPNTTPVTLNNNHFYPIDSAVMKLYGVGTLVDTASIATAQWISPAPSLSGNKIWTQATPNPAAMVVPPLCTGCVKDSSRTFAANDSDPFSVPTFSDGTQYAAATFTQSQLKTTASAGPLWDGPLAARPAFSIDFRASQWPVTGASTAVGVAGLPVYMTQTQTAPALSLQEDAQGQHVLTLTDATRTSNFAYEPYLQAQPQYAAGTNATVKFTVKFGKTANILHQWRTDGVGQQNGPVVTFLGNGVNNFAVKVGTQTVATLDVNTFHTFEIKATLGNPTWTLSIDGGAAQSYNVANANWGALNNLVFISNGNDNTVTASFSEIHIDNN